MDDEIKAQALRVIAEALKEPAGGSYHPARAFCDAHGIYHDDVEGLGVLYGVAKFSIGEEVTV